MPTDDINGTEYLGDTCLKNNLRNSNRFEDEHKTTKEARINGEESLTNDWLSPSDTLIGIVKLQPPFTSKIIRVKAHAGLLRIGDEILEAEYIRFHKKLSTLLDENDAAWLEILKHEQCQIKMKVRRWYEDLFKDKCKILTNEIDFFYTKTLQELESHLRYETNLAFINLRAAMVTDLNIQINRKLLIEKQILNATLNKKFVNELSKIRRYYSLLLDNETDRCTELINSVTGQRNDALQALCAQLNSENITSCMYIMSMERKKCQIKNFCLKNHLDLDIVEHLQKLVTKNDYLKKLKKEEKTVSQINLTWEEKIRKILEMFTKFISFSLELIPEQTNFLLQLEKLITLQLHEMQSTPFIASPILVDAEQFENVFQFLSPEDPTSEPKKPLIVEGDISAPIQKVYGSRESLPSDVELPFIIVDKDYIYAKCHKFEEIKEFIECQYSKAGSHPSQHSALPQEEYKPMRSLSSSLWSNIEYVYEIPTTSIASSWTEFEQEHLTTSSSSSSSQVIVKSFPPSSSSALSSSRGSRSDVIPSETCPAKTCIEWIKKYSFPYLNTYLDYNEQNYSRVQAIVSKKRVSTEPHLIKPSKLARSNLPFLKTDTADTQDTATQYSSREDLLIVSQQVLCPCIQNANDAPSSCDMDKPAKQLVKEVITRRDQSIYNLMDAHPELLNVFTEEKYDYKFLKL